MIDQLAEQAAEYIHPLNMNGLKGRMLRLPPPKGKKREILFIYGHHSSLERWWGVVQDMNQYGGVTMPDLPGFGGMDSFYKVGRKPTIDNLADYLASFIKLRYKGKRLTIAGLSFGFVVATRMLQNYPDIAKKVDLVVSVVGFAHREDFVFSKRRYWAYRLGAGMFAYRPTAFFFKNTFLNPLILRLAYSKTYNAREKFKDKDKAEHKQVMDTEIHLWHTNDVWTHWYTVTEFLKLDNCNKQVNLPLWHVSVKADRYFDNHLVEQHMRIIYTGDFKHAISKMDSHAPSVIGDIKTAKPLMPTALRRVLSKY